MFLPFKWIFRAFVKYLLYAHFFWVRLWWKKSLYTTYNLINIVPQKPKSSWLIQDFEGQFLIFKFLLCQNQNGNHRTLKFGPIFLLQIIMDMEECRNAWTALCINHQTNTKVSLDNTSSGFEIDSAISKKSSMAFWEF